MLSPYLSAVAPVFRVVRPVRLSLQAFTASRMRDSPETLLFTLPAGVGGSLASLVTARVPALDRARRWWIPPHLSTFLSLLMTCVAAVG